MYMNCTSANPVKYMVYYYDVQYETPSVCMCVLILEGFVMYNVEPSMYIAAINTQCCILLYGF